jgi:hypothetical protein
MFSSKRLIIVLAVFAVVLMRPERTATMQACTTPWCVGDVFVGIGDPDSGRLAYVMDDPDTEEVEAGDDPTTLIDEMIAFNRLGTYQVFRPDGTWVEDLHVGAPTVTTGCAIERVDATTDHFWATGWDYQVIDTLSSAAGRPKVGTLDLLAEVSNPPGIVAVESIVFDSDGNFYIGIPDEESDVNPTTFDWEYDGFGTVVKFNNAREWQAEYRVPVTLYPTGPSGTYSPEPTAEKPRGADWIDLSADGTTLFYTSEDRFIRTMKFDVDPDTAGDQPGPGPGNAMTIDGIDYDATPGVWGYADPDLTGDSKLFALRLLPPGDGSGGLLVASPSGLYRLNAQGKTIAVYRVPADAGGFFALNLSPDAQYVWTATNLPQSESAVFQFHVASGRLMTFTPPATGVETDRLALPGPAWGMCVKLEYTAQSIDCTDAANTDSPLCKPIEACSVESPGDDDNDGLADLDDPDCAHLVEETCGDAVDNDHDGLVDEICERTNAEGQTVSVAPGAGPPGETRTYTITGLPPGLSFDAATGEITGTLTYEAAGDYSISLTLQRTTTTGVSMPASGAFVWHVTDEVAPNGPPAFEVENFTTNEREPFSLVIPAPTDPDDDPMEHSIYWTYESITLDYDAATRTLSGTGPEVTGDTDFTFLMTVSDVDANGDPMHQVTKAFTWTVVNVNRAPVIANPGPQASGEGSSPTLQIVAPDPDTGDSVTFALSAPPGLPIAIAPTTGLISVTAPGGFPYSLGTQTFSVTVTVTDSHGLAGVPVTFPWTINNVNRPPTVSVPAIPDRLVNTLLTFTATAADLDGDTLTFSQGAPWPTGFALTQLSSTTARVTGTSAVGGTLNLPIVVTDANGAQATATATATFFTNRPPVCLSAVPSVSILWPPNHKLVPVKIKRVTDPDRKRVVIKVTGIRQDEPTNAEGDGDTAIDGKGVGTNTAWVRAERSGTKRVPGNGRVYHIYFTATDALGASCSGEVTVGVPHDRGGHARPIDGGPLYDSTVSFPPGNGNGNGDGNDDDDHDRPHYDGDGCDHDRGRGKHRDGDRCEHDRDARPRHYDGDGDDHDKGRKGHRDGDGCEHDRDNRPPQRRR